MPEITELTLRIDPVIVEVIDAEIENAVPRKSRNARIVEVLADAFAPQIKRAQKQKAKQQQPQDEQKAA